MSDESKPTIRPGRVHNSLRAKDERFYGTKQFSLVKLGATGGLPKVGTAVFFGIAIPWTGLVSLFISPSFFAGLGAVIMLFPPLVITWLIMTSRDASDRVSDVDRLKFKYTHKLREPHYRAGNAPYEPGYTHVGTEIVTPRRLYQNTLTS